jgi:hypothetical protein
VNNVVVCVYVVNVNVVVCVMLGWVYIWYNVKAFLSDVGGVLNEFGCIFGTC